MARFGSQGATARLHARARRVGVGRLKLNHVEREEEVGPELLTPLAALYHTVKALAWSQIMRIRAPERTIFFARAARAAGVRLRARDACVVTHGGSRALDL